MDGEGFLGTSRVSFGAVPATQFTLYSDNEIVATVPAAQATGTVDVTVTNPSGTSATSSLDQFTYVTTPIRTLSQYNPACLPPKADATDPVDSGFTINFFGQSYSDVYVSNDGYVSRWPGGWCHEMQCCLPRAPAQSGTYLTRPRAGVYPRPSRGKALRAAALRVCA